VARAAASRGGSRGALAAPTPAYRPGELVVKFKPEFRPPPASGARRRQGAASTGSAHLDALHQRYRASALQPLLTLPTSGARRRGAGDAAAWQAHMQRLRQRYPIRARRADPKARVPDLSTIYTLSVAPDTDIQRLAAEYGADPSVEYAEPNYVRQLFFTPNDPFFSSSGSWGQTFPDLWGLHNIRADSAWDLSTGTGVVVAVIDTGLNFDHPELAPNVWTNPGEDLNGDGRLGGYNACPMPNGDFNCVDDDGNGYADDVHGWQFPAKTGDVYDHVGHGSHVSGTLAAVGNNGGGVIGVAWNARLMPLNVWGDFAGAADVNIARAVVYAVENGAAVVNMSFGGLGDSLVQRDAIAFGVSQGLVLVAAAGNDAIDVRSVSPADLDGVIAVGAVDHLDQPAGFSNFGGKLELAAPGGGDSGPPRYLPEASILSTTGVQLDPLLEMDAFVPPFYMPSFQRLAGTSMAAPHVSGVAALILSRHPEFTVEQVRQVLRDSADDLGPPGRDARYGYGRLNAARAVAVDAVAVARLHAPQHLSRLHGERITVEGTVENPGGGAPSWQLLFGPQGQAPAVLATGSGAVDHAVLATVDTAPLERGNYQLRLEVTGPNGARATDTNIFTRLASRPYIRQVTDQAGTVFLPTNAMTDDGDTLLWGSNSHPGSFQIRTTDLTTGRDQVIAEYQLGNDIFPSPFPVTAAMSGDGSTVVFAAPEDRTPANTELADRNFQLFRYDTRTKTIEQLTHGVGGSFFSFNNFDGGISITRNGNRVAFRSSLDLDPSVGNADGNSELFVWEGGANAIHQVTNTFGVQDLAAPAVTPDGTRIAFGSSAHLDPSAEAGGLFVYDVPNRTIRRVAPGGVMSPTGALVAGVEVTGFSPGTPRQYTVYVVDVASGEVTEILTTPWSEFLGSADAQFSPDGTRLFFGAPIERDHVFPFDPRFHPPLALFQYDFASGTLRQLTGFFASVAVPASGRLALWAHPSDVDLDPEGTNSDGGLNVGSSGTTAEIFLLDPETGGGFLHVKRGRITQAPTADRDRFTVSGTLFQPSGRLEARSVAAQEETRFSGRWPGSRGSETGLGI
jgi:subtilisin family serine protease/Tol biopolymer transport system component